MIKRLSRQQVLETRGFIHAKQLGSQPDLADQNSAYSISNILQSAQLNRELPPMKSYNFTPIENQDLSRITPIMDDLCMAGNLQSQLTDSINRFNESLQNVHQSDKDTQSAQNQETTDTVHD